MHISVTGLPARELVSFELRSVDAQRTPWLSSATFRTDAKGRINLDRTSALSGGYSGIWGMGLVATMHPTRHSPAGAYVWNDRSFSFVVTARAQGRAAAATVFHRGFGQQPIRQEHESLDRRGFIGDYWAPVGLTRRTAILAFGGSEGGESTYLLGKFLAGEGYPTLSLAYFKEPGLPQTLSNIPLEYFAKALTWLSAQPEVDPNRIVTLGASRGSEAALLLGVHFPQLVHGVVALVPSNVSLCSFPGCSGPAWTLDGKPLPYTRQFDDPAPTDDPAAVIPVEQVQGPVFLDCAGRDEIWFSCAYAKAIIQRLEAHHVSYPHTLAIFPKAAHLLGTLVPYEPGVMSIDEFGFAQANEQAREKQWPRLLTFLASLAYSSTAIRSSTRLKTKAPSASATAAATHR